MELKPKWVLTIKTVNSENTQVEINLEIQTRMEKNEEIFRNLLCRNLGYFCHVIKRSPV